MHKTIWYISKYCTIENENSTGSRGWLLSKEFAKKGNNVVLITSNTDEIIDPNLTNSILKNPYNSNLNIIILKILRYTNSNSIRRILSWFDFELALFLLKKNNLHKPDAIVVSSLSLLTIINGIYLKKKYSCKLVFEVRDIWPLTLTEIGRYRNYNPGIIFLKIIERLGYLYSDLIIGTMPNLSEHVKKTLGQSKNVHCIPMGVSENQLKKQKNAPEFFKKYLKPDNFNIIYSGSIGMTNCLNTFFEAAELLKNFPKIKFIIVGEGALRKSFLKKFGHLPNFLYFTSIKKNQMNSFLSYADVLYYSTYNSKIYDYGQSANKIIDYMIASKPIIMSYSGYPSMVNEANCGYIIPSEDPGALRDQILKMYNMPRSEISILGTNGRKWLLSNRKYKNLADKYLKLIFK